MTRGQAIVVFGPLALAVVAGAVFLLASCTTTTQLPPVRPADLQLVDSSSTGGMSPVMRSSTFTIGPKGGTYVEREGKTERTVAFEATPAELDQLYRTLRENAFDVSLDAERLDHLWQKQATLPERLERSLLPGEHTLKVVLLKQAAAQENTAPRGDGDLVTLERTIVVPDVKGLTISVAGDTVHVVETR